MIFFFYFVENYSRRVRKSTNKKNSGLSVPNSHLLAQIFVIPLDSPIFMEVYFNILKVNLRRAAFDLHAAARTCIFKCNSKDLKIVR